MIGWKQIIAWESKITFLYYFHKNLCDIMRAAFKKAALKIDPLSDCVDSIYKHFTFKKD